MLDKASISTTWKGVGKGNAEAIEIEIQTQLKLKGNRMKTKKAVVKLKFNPKLEFNPTEEHHFKNGRDKIRVQIQNSATHGFAWRMSVNGKWSHITYTYSGILTHKGYGLTTAYFTPEIQEFVPFKILPSKEV